MTNEATDPASRGIDELCRQATQLARTAPAPLRSVRVQAGELLVALEWPDTPAVPTVGVAVPAVPAVTPVAGETPPAVGTFTVAAPLVGTFYRSPAPGAPPFVEVGQDVASGQQVAIVEAMKLMNPVEVDRPGRVVEVCVADGAEVEYGEVLFVLASPEGDAA
ncbi:biotin/lipoyl-containing protein [Micromonospora sp. WMMA1363]|uniref:acetyl-CoA carboxylase biotin carboxyl carrier protein n=1 Tax=Micromonospora sp. WMMA1363 TaxID=3053985 RepID=UPI00259CF6B6|nr:biotin/lipoyl-containing protein [Micromonospora sp. WMMA1363]MDM4718192.1 biotin/lipoyl-containing protein [Micromonospora sp. WMMA1363]